MQFQPGQCLSGRNIQFLPGKLTICGLSFKWNEYTKLWPSSSSSELEYPFKYVFKDVFLTLHPGSGLLLQGPNGSGKTTFLRCISGFLRPVNGCVLWDDVPIRSPQYFGWARSKIHFLSATVDRLDENRTAYENLLRYSLLCSRCESKMESLMEEKLLDYAIDRMGLRSLLWKPVKNLSSGQRRRVSFARILASPTPIWLLDEPSIALDRQAVTILEEVIDEHREDGGIVIVASHVNFRLDHAVSLQFDYS